MESVPSQIHKSWHPYLGELFNHDSVKYLKYKILTKPGVEIFPSKENIFNVFTMPMKEVKVILLGQD